jgi:hypothetical protein
MDLGLAGNCCRAGFELVATAPIDAHGQLARIDQDVLFEFADCLIFVQLLVRVDRCRAVGQNFDDELRMALYEPICCVARIACDENIWVARPGIRCDDLDVICIRATGTAPQYRPDNRNGVCNDLSVVIRRAGHGKHRAIAKFMLRLLALFPGKKFSQSKWARVNAHGSSFQLRLVAVFDRDMIRHFKLVRIDPRSVQETPRCESDRTRQPFQRKSCEGLGSEHRLKRTEDVSHRARIDFSDALTNARGIDRP